VGGYLEETMFPVPVFIWLVALVPLGWRVLTGGVDDVIKEPVFA
jgi:hypothetical protein